MTPADRARAVVDQLIATGVQTVNNTDVTLRAILATALRAERAAVWQEAARVAETYFEPCDQPADISARECGEQIAAALRQKGEGE